MEKGCTMMCLINPSSALLSQEGLPSHAAEPAADHHSVDVEATQGSQFTVSC